MSSKVFGAQSPVEGLDVFVHNLKDASQRYAVLAVNPKDSLSSSEIPEAAEQYLLAVRQAGKVTDHLLWAEGNLVDGLVSCGRLITHLIYNYLGCPCELRFVTK